MAAKQNQATDKPLYVLRNAKGEYYSFTDQSTYDGPQFSHDPGNAKQMSAQGCGNVRKLLSKPSYHGVQFERISVSDLIADGTLRAE